MELTLYFISKKSERLHTFFIFGWDDYGDPQLFEYEQGFEQDCHRHRLKGDRKASKIFLTTSYTEALKMKEKLRSKFLKETKLVIKKIIDG